jgi:hypothetical protein
VGLSVALLSGSRTSLSQGAAHIDKIILRQLRLLYMWLATTTATATPAALGTTDWLCRTCMQPASALSSE